MNVDVYFPVSWRFGDRPSDGLRGPPVVDAGAIYIARFEEEWPVGTPLVLRKTSLQEMIADCISGWGGADGVTHSDHVPASDALAEALRQAANTLDAAKLPLDCRA